MPNGSKVAIIAALQREVRDLVAGAEVQHMQTAGGTLPVYRLGDVSIACAGVGPEAAGRATDAMIQHMHPELIVSVGFAGAVDPAVVAERATAHGIQFVAIKSVSDTTDTTLPDFSRFVRENGEFATIPFLLHTIFHPTLWPELRRLAVHTGVAAKSLSSALRHS